MSNRNFDSRVIIQRLQSQNNAQNQYRYNQAGIRINRNPQNSNPSPQRILSYMEGLQTTYYQGLYGGEYVSSIGGIANILAENAPPSFFLPQPPTSLVATPSGTQINISFVSGDPGSDFITNYQYSIDGGSTFLSFSPPQISSPVVITGLTLNTTYSIALKAVTSVGASASSAIISSTTLNIPSAPTIDSITPANSQLSVSFTAGANGGSAITNYQYSTNGGSTFTAFSPVQTSSPLIISGLTNGVSYDIVLKAVTAIGAGNASNTVSGTPIALPSAPTIIYSLPGDGEAYIYYTAGNDGGNSITNYEYTLDNGTSWTALIPAVTTTPILIPSLTNAVLYTIKIRAVNIIGASSASNGIDVTPQSASAATSSLYYDPDDSSSYSGSGTSVLNIGSYGTMTGTTNGSVTYVIGSGSISRYVFDFNTGDRITFGSYNFGQAFTISVWLYPRSNNSINGILANVGANQAPLGFKIGWNNWLSNNKTMYFEGGNGTSGGADATVEDTIVYDTWQYLTYIIDKDTRRILYLKNGVPVTTASYSDNIIVANLGTNNSTFTIGSFTDGSYSMNAQLGYLKVFNGVLTVGQIQTDYNNTKASFGL